MDPQLQPDWNKFIDEIAEQAIDEWIEQKHILEVDLKETEQI